MHHVTLAAALALASFSASLLGIHVLSPNATDAAAVEQAGEPCEAEAPEQWNLEVAACTE